MKKSFILIFLIFLFFSLVSIAQENKSIRVYLPDFQSGSLYGLKEVDSISFDVTSQLQNIHIEDMVVSYSLAEVDSVKFSKDDASRLYTCLKFNSCLWNVFWPVDIRSRASL